RLPDDVDYLEAVIHDNGIKLVVFDTLLNYVPPKLSYNNDQEIRAALTPLARVAQNTGAAIILVRHFTKNTSADALHRGGGSVGGIVGVVRVVTTVTRSKHDTDSLVFSVVAGNVAPPSEPRFFKLTTNGAFGIPKVEWIK